MCEEETPVDVPVRANLKHEQGNRFGSVPGLDDEELAGGHELERQAFIEQFGPILALPVQKGSGWIQPELDENGMDASAFATIDFERLVPEFDKAKYKADKLREELKDLVIRLDIAMGRIPGKAKYLVLKDLKMGIRDVDQIDDFDMWLAGRLYLRVRRLRSEIRGIEERRRKRKMRELEHSLAELET